MKLKAIIIHPYTLVISFSLVFISGQPMSGFYFLYLVLGLYYGAIYSIIGSLGICVILFSHFKFKGTHKNLDAGFINLIGAVLLIISLFLFFYLTRDVNISTIFVQLFPFISLLIFCILVTCFVTILP
ncbi:MAG: hypothetical protein ABIN89_11900 [Chitinophagaceae bacterium]